MKYITWILALALAIIVVAFSVNNIGAMAIDLWPLDLTVMWPTYGVVLGAILIGFFFGATVMWFSGHKSRRNARQQRAEARRLGRELESLKKSTPARTGERAGAVPQIPAPAGD